jgi:hypothetical protein
MAGSKIISFVLDRSCSITRPYLKNFIENRAEVKIQSENMMLVCTQSGRGVNLQPICFIKDQVLDAAKAEAFSRFEMI